MKTPVNIIFDTDMWTDIDDALALAMLHALHDRREINLVAVTVSTERRESVSYTELVNSFYGHPNIPVGMVRDGIGVNRFHEILPDFKKTSTYTESMSARTYSDGVPLHPRRPQTAEDVPDAVGLLRRTLAAQPDGSVVFVQVGYSTNLARLLASAPDAASPLSGVDLVRRKARFLSVMAGQFDDLHFKGKTRAKGSPEFNVMVDVPAAQALFSKWPTPIVVSGLEVGLSMVFPAETVDKDYGYVQAHPVADAYRLFCEEMKGTLTDGWPHDRPTWDLTSVLYAAGPDRNYFELSKPGRITIMDDGRSQFEELENGTHRYLIVDEKQKARTLEAMKMLASQPPIIDVQSKSRNGN